MWAKYLGLWACMAFGACKSQSYEQFVFAISIPFPVPDGAGNWLIKELNDTMQIYRQEERVLMIKRAVVLPKLDSFDVFGTAAMKNEYYAYLQGEAMGVKMSEEGQVSEKMEMKALHTRFGAAQFRDFFKSEQYRLLEVRANGGAKTERYTPKEKKDFSYPDTVIVERAPHASGSLFQLGADVNQECIRKLVLQFNAVEEASGIIPKRRLTITVLKDGTGEEKEIQAVFSKIRKLL
jgi:hypothetical protein